MKPLCVRCFLRPRLGNSAQDAKAGHFTAVYLVLELIAAGITLTLLIP
jgi:hypothetical protein